MSAPTPQLDPRRWKALIFICLAQLMVVLDGTIVNIALPSAQHDLDFSDGSRQWVVTAYALSFGGLLLLGGRIADKWGRRRAFLIGLTGFALASALGGAAANTEMLLGARALQGVFGALLAPAAMSLLTVTFTEGKERAKAFGIYGAISGGGAAVGLLLGGVLTEYANWRWTLLVNVFFAAAAIIGTVLEIKEPPGARNSDRLDVPGVLLASGGLAALVYAFSRAESDGWGSTATLGFFAAAVVLLALFVVVERRVEAPLLPLRVVLDRNRGGAYLALGMAVVGMFGLFLFLTYYLQVVLEYSPVVSGVAFLPMVAGMMTGSTQVGARLMNRVAPRFLMGSGFLVASGALVILAQIEVDTSYATVLLPGLFLVGLGMGTAFMPAMSLATRGVKPRDAGVASAMVNTSQQIGGAIGTALLSTLATSATTGYAADHARAATTPSAQHLLQLQAMVHGFSTAIWWAAGILALASATAFLVIGSRPGRPTDKGGSSDQPDEATVPSFAH